MNPAATALVPRFSAPASVRRDDTDTVLNRLEWATLVHVGLLVVATTWAFGGQAERVREPLSVLASAGVLITAAGLASRAFRRSPRFGLWRCLPALLLLGLLVLAGVFSPSLREDQSGELLVLASVPPWLPSSARPALAHRALWYFGAVWVSALNVLLFLRRGRTLRALLLILAGNALLLAIVGTLQKLSGAGGIFFGTVPVPQPRFFSTFVYHNHWGAFTVMMLALVAGLGWHHVRAIRSRDMLQGPLPAVVFAVVTLGITLPLSGSRSCTLLGAALLGGASIHVAVYSAHRRREKGHSALPPIIGLVLLWIGFTGAAWLTGRDTIRDRLETSRSQIAAIREAGGIGDRALLYGNTWRMALDKPVFGWGMASYPHVFHGFYNTRVSPDRLPVFYNDAHNDWLQAVAEHGIAGTGLLAACAAVPLWLCRRDILRSMTARYLLAGLGMVLAYALLEFPFGNRANVLVWWTLFFAALAHTRAMEGSPSAPPAARERI